VVQFSPCATSYPHAHRSVTDLTKRVPLVAGSLFGRTDLRAQKFSPFCGHVVGTRFESLLGLSWAQVARIRMQALVKGARLVAGTDARLERGAEHARGR
jgi:hypothetical protein